MNAPCKDFSDLPLMLTAPQLAAALGISRAGAYALMHSRGFPTFKIGKRIMVPKQQMMDWIDRQTDGGRDVDTVSKHWICMAQIRFHRGEPLQPPAHGRHLP